MPRTSSHAALALGLALLLAACGGRATTTTGDPPTPEAVRVLALVNQARATPTACGAEGRFAAAAPLTLDPRLSAAARLHTVEMRRRGVTSHEGADGGTVADRVDRAGYPWRSLGENVASGYDHAEEVVRAWLASDGHCANIAYGGFTHLGVGHDGDYWTQVFGSAR